MNRYINVGRCYYPIYTNIYCLESCYGITLKKLGGIQNMVTLMINILLPVVFTHFKLVTLLVDRGDLFKLYDNFVTVTNFHH